MDYTLHQLRVFLKVVETQSITRAAEALHLTQPAVSIQLRKLQDQFEIPLTEVIGRQLYVTDFGREIAEAAGRILEEVHAIRFRAEAYRGQVAGRIKVSVVSTGKYVMPYFLSGFLKAHSAVDLVMDVTNKRQVVRSLEKNEVDFALVSVLPDNLRIERIPLMANKLYLVANKDEPVPGKALSTNQMAGLPLIFREPGSATRQAMETFMKKADEPVRKTMALTSNEAVKQAVLAGLGYSIMPIIGLRNELRQADVQIIPAQGLPITTTWNLIWLRQKKFAPAAKAYLDYVQEEKDKIIADNFGWFEKY